MGEAKVAKVGVVAEVKWLITVVCPPIVKQ